VLAGGVAAPLDRAAVGEALLAPPARPVVE
jgi:hypothetical protein